MARLSHFKYQKYIYLDSLLYHLSLLKFCQNTLYSGCRIIFFYILNKKRMFSKLIKPYLISKRFLSLRLVYLQFFKVDITLIAKLRKEIINVFISLSFQLESGKNFMKVKIFVESDILEN
jgi:hypothetical protein